MTKDELKAGLIEVLGKTSAIDEMEKDPEFQEIGPEVFSKVAGSVATNKIMLLFSEYYDIDPEMLVKVESMFRK